MKSINIIKMDYAKYNKLTEGQCSSLKEIAILCPYIDGPAVYTARALLRGTDIGRMEYMNECEKVYPVDNNSYRELNKHNTSNRKLLFSVYPNPANNFIYVSCDSIYRSFTIEDLNGKEIFSNDLNADAKVNLYDVSNLSSGMYIYKIRNLYGLEERGKLIINKH